MQKLRVGKKDPFSDESCFCTRTWPAMPAFGLLDLPQALLFGEVWRTNGDHSPLPDDEVNQLKALVLRAERVVTPMRKIDKRFADADARIIANHAQLYLGLFGQLPGKPKPELCIVLGPPEVYCDVCHDPPSLLEKSVLGEALVLCADRILEGQVVRGYCNRCFAAFKHASIERATTPSERLADPSLPTRTSRFRQDVEKLEYMCDPSKEIVEVPDARCFRIRFGRYYVSTDLLLRHHHHLERSQVSAMGDMDALAAVRRAVGAASSWVSPHHAPRYFDIIYTWWVLRTFTCNIKRWRDGPVHGYFEHAEPLVFLTTESAKEEFFRVATALHDAHLIRFTDNHCTCCLRGPMGRVHW